MTALTFPTRLRPPRPGPAADRAPLPNQLLFREVNEQLASRLDPTAAAEAEIEIVCECEHRGCTTAVRLPRRRYEWVRRFPTRFVVSRGHANPIEERVVERLGAYEIVEEVGPSAHTAVVFDPRRLTTRAGP